LDSDLDPQQCLVVVLVEEDTLLLVGRKVLVVGLVVDGVLVAVL
jgi:hypothetical protein